MFSDSAQHEFTCQRRPGSWEHEAIDVDSYCRWGVDYLKLGASARQHSCTRVCAFSHTHAVGGFAQTVAPGAPTNRSTRLGSSSAQPLTNAPRNAAFRWYSLWRAAMIPLAAALGLANWRIVRLGQCLINFINIALMWTFAESISWRLSCSVAYVW